MMKKSKENFLVQEIATVRYKNQNSYFTEKNI